jgi:hypothetical protein
LATTEALANAVDNENKTPFIIPDDSRAQIRALVDLHENAFNDFVAALVAAKPSILPSALAAQIAKNAPKIPDSTVSALVDEIIAMESLKQSASMDAQEFAKALADAAIERSGSDFLFTHTDAEILKRRIETIFSSDHVLELNTKIISVLTDHNNVFLSAAILSDMRPVFNEDASAIEAMTIVHNLRIHFEHDLEHKDVYIALDTLDLHTLESVIARAKNKAALLKSAIHQTGIPFVDAETTNG